MWRETSFNKFSRGRFFFKFAVSYYFIRKNHIDIINNLERFYGDETLGNLLRHSKTLVEECQNFQNILRQEEEYGEEEE